MKNLYLLGSTGSIGTQVLEIVSQHLEDFKVITMSANKNISLLRHQIKQFKPLYVSVTEKNDAMMLQTEFPTTCFGYGKEGLIKAATFQKEDKIGLVVNALVGIAGLVPTIEAIKIHRNIALANKETLVVGGFLIKKLLKEFNVKMYPIDSEHSAIWQCLQGSKPHEIKKIIITASGGAFRDYTRLELENATLEDALKHPNWAMGYKITIDSATMMNKGFEMIEACYLFDLPIEKVETILHSESIIHSMVEFVDSSVIAQLSSHDMKLPIQYALYFPNRIKSMTKSLDFVKLKSLHFEPINQEKYPCLTYAIQSFRIGGSMPCVLNAANEACVSLFLEGKIRFLEIEKIIKTELDKHLVNLSPTLEDLLEIDYLVKTSIYQTYSLR
ncbi:MAG: 1-deoxy-D-xylulose-5-phosphate reductoisomerase [Firmicutes bacterium]|nr:1-deoxy-D-xylulose-5-phosphate reductoisomerase [Bacillota bacterium]